MLAEPIAGQHVANASTVVHGDDSGLHVTFRKVAVKNEIASTNAGRPIFRDVDYVRIITPGDALNIYDQPVKEQHKQRFARLWDAYQKGQEQAQDGTPLEAWPHMVPSKIAAYKFANVFTVEGIAAIADSNASHMPMDWRDDQVKARAYLQAAEDSSFAQRLAADNKAKDEQIAALTANLADLAAKVEALAKPEKKAK